MVAQAVSPALPILDDFCHGLLGPLAAFLVVYITAGRDRMLNRRWSRERPAARSPRESPHGLQRRVATSLCKKHKMNQERLTASENRSN